MNQAEEKTEAIGRARRTLVQSSLDWNRVPGIGLEVPASPTCRAVEMAFRHLDLDVEALAEVAQLDDLEEIANRLGRGLQVLVRRVDLHPHWWRANGEILVVRHRDHGPCALIPHHDGWRARIARQRRDASPVPVDREFAEACEPRAFEFIRIPEPETIGIAGLLRTATRDRWGEIRARIGAGIASAILGLVIPIVTAILINQVIPDGESKGVVGIGLALLVAAFATSGLALIGGLATLRFDNTVAFRTETTVLSRVIDRFRRPPDQSDGQVIQRITSVNAAMSTVTHSTDKVVVESIRGFAHLLLLLYYSWVLALVALVTLGIGLTAIVIEAAFQNRFVNASQQATGRAESLSIEMLEGLDSIRDRAIDQPLMLRWTALRSQLSNLTYLSSTVSNLRTLLLTLLGGATSVLVYFLVAEHYAGTLNSGNFVASTIAISAVMASLGKTAGVVAAIATVAPVFVRLKPLLQSDVRGSSRGSTNSGRSYRFRFEDVSISDTSWGRNDVTSLTIDVDPGQFTAIVCERPVSGRVLLESLVGLRAPQTGRVLFDDQSIDDFDSTALRRAGAILIETPRVLSVSLRKNLDLEEVYDDETIEAAMERTGLSELVAKLPLGLNTILDPRNTGLVLATRLAATRCLLKRIDFVVAVDQPVLANTGWGRAFMADLVARECTRVVVTSNPALTAKADRILVLGETGEQIANGTPEELRRRLDSLPPRIREAIG